MKIFMGMMREPWDDFIKKYTGAICRCSCGCDLHHREAIRCHWQAGHFDYAQYRDIPDLTESNPSAPTINPSLNFSKALPEGFRASHTCSKNGNFGTPYYYKSKRLFPEEYVFYCEYCNAEFSINFK